MVNFLLSLESQCLESTLIVVDNGSTDRTLEIVNDFKSSFSGLKIQTIPMNSNVGVAEANNVGIRSARDMGASTIILVNNDVVFEGHCLHLLCDHVAATGHAVVPTIYYGDVRTKVWFGGGYINEWLGHSIHNEAQPHFEVERITYAPTCCMAIPQQYLNEIGLMDRDYFVYFDDTDFCYRMNRRRLQLDILRDATMLHFVSSSTGENSPFSVYFGDRNRLYFISKNISGMRKIAALTYFAVTRTLRILAYVVKGDSKRRRAIVLAVKDYLANRMGEGSYFEMIHRMN